MEENKLTPFTGYQKFIIAIVTLIQFTVILDFMVMSPLGPTLMPALGITPSQFGLVVAAYAFSAGISGILCAGFADKYDRKKFLLFFYIGFVVGTAFCALAPTYELLLAARVITGLFGGVIGAISMAIIIDLFEINQRGRVMGMTQMGFAASQVLGIPLALFLAPRFGWNSPFTLIVGLATVMGLVIVIKMKPITKHLEQANAQSANALGHLMKTLREKKYQTGFIATALLSLGGFMMMPFGSAFAAYNLGVDVKNDLVYVFVGSGIASLISFPILGRLSDKYDKFIIFTVASIWAIVMVIVHTHWSQIPLWLVVASTVLMFTGIMGRIVPSTILVSALPKMTDRGAFMAINSSLQQMAGGVASIIAGYIVVQQTPTSPLENFDIVGYVVAFFIVVSVYLIYRINNIVKNQLKNAPKGPSGAPAPKHEEPVLVGE